MKNIFNEQKRVFQYNPEPTIKHRKSHLLKLKALILENKDEICEAINTDYGNRSTDETMLAEIIPSVHSINYALENINDWAKDSTRSLGLHLGPGKVRVKYQPLGVVGIIVPWNYPLYLAIGPMVTALAAGNHVMVKMSEFTPTFSALFAKLIKESLGDTKVVVIQGDHIVAEEFTKLPFDHILFTGSTRVGKKVMAAAAENLTPVTLELGGKSPCIIGEKMPIKDAVRRIVFGKSMNAGQTCVAPDYVLVPEKKVDEFVLAYTKQFDEYYPDPYNGQYTSIIDVRQQIRLKSYIWQAMEKGATVVNGSSHHEDTTKRIMLPKLVLNPNADMDVMKEEIFGPILPIIGYTDYATAVEFVTARPNPLALYLFSYDQKEKDKLINNSLSGAVSINETLFHVAVDDIPFGGVGDSGIGHYHGIEGFHTFSKARPILEKYKLNFASFLVPPYAKLHRLAYKYLLK